jgi:hypothetical protein
MSWRDAARKYFPDHAPVPNVPNRPMGEPETAIGTFGLIGTGGGDVGNRTELDAHVADWMDCQERAAIMQYDGGMTRAEAESAAAKFIRLDERRNK